jgi:hypothetical protein
MIDKQSSGLSTVIFLLIFFAVGAGLMVWGGIVLRNASVSKEWPAVQGEIVSSYVDSSSDEDGTTYSADIEFQYVVDDRRLTADTVNFGEYGSSNRNHAADIVAKYPVGKMVTVYYDPAEPETAVLEPGVTWSSYVLLLMGLVFIIAPAIILGVNIRSAQN